MGNLYCSSSLGNDAWAGTIPLPNGAGNGPKATLSALDGVMAAGDTGWLLRGDSWNESFAPTTRASLTYFRPYGNAYTTPPQIAPLGAGAGVTLANVNNVVFYSIDIMPTNTPDLSVTGTSDSCYFLYCRLRNNNVATVGRGLNQDGSGAAGIFLFNCEIEGHLSNGILMAGGKLTIRNTAIWGNGASYTTNRQGLRQTGGTVDIDYSLVYGNNNYPNGNVAVTAGTFTDGGHNLGGNLSTAAVANNWGAAWPFKTAYTVNQAYLSIQIDDHDVAYVQDIISKLPTGAHITFFVSPSYIDPAEEADLQAMAAAGHEIAGHTWSHSYMDATTGFTVTSTNTNPTVNVDVANTQIILSCDEVGNRVTLVWDTTPPKTIDDLKTAVSGKGWTITNTTGIDGHLWLDSLADSTGAQAVGAGYACSLDRSAPNYKFFYNEHQETQDWLTTLLGDAPTTMAYPNGNNDAANWAYLRDEVGLLGARATNTSSPDLGTKLESITLYKVAGYTMWDSLFEADPTTQEKVIKGTRHLWLSSIAPGRVRCNFAHSSGNAVAQTVAWMAEEWIALGGTVVTFGDMVAAIRADHATADDLTWTKSYTDSYNPRLLADSPARNAGVTVAITGLTIDADAFGNPVSGITPDIGAYEFPVPSPMGLTPGLGLGGRMIPPRRRRR